MAFHRAAHSGSAPFFSQDDLHLLRDHDDSDLPLETLIALPPPSDPAQSFYTTVVSLVYHITELGREASSKLTGVRARTADRIDEAFVADYLKRVDLACSVLPELERRAKLFNKNRPPSRSGENIGMIVRSLPVTLFSLM